MRYHALPLRLGMRIAVTGFSVKFVIDLSNALHRVEMPDSLACPIGFFVICTVFICHATLSA